MSTAGLQQRFGELTDEGRPLRERTTEIGVEQMRLSYEITAAILREQFPDAEVETQAVLSTITPADAGRSAHETAAALKKQGVTPRKIVLQPNLLRVLVIR